MSNRSWIIFGVIVAVLFGGLIYLGQRNRVDVSSVNQSEIQKGSEQSGTIADAVFGKSDSKVILMEYGDYQCPGCGSAYPTIKSVTEKYQNQLGFVFRNFPITTLHPNARAAAAAAETAGILGKYWEMHDQLYQNQNQWESASATERTTFFEGYAKTIGLDESKFKDILSSRASDINAKINFDQSLGQRAGVTGTPTFYLNGKALDQYTKDGKLVDKSVHGAVPVWQDENALDTLIIRPALEKAGVDLSAIK